MRQGRQPRIATAGGCEALPQATVSLSRGKREPDGSKRVKVPSAAPPFPAHNPRQGLTAAPRQQADRAPRKARA